MALVACGDEKPLSALNCEHGSILEQIDTPCRLAADICPVILGLQGKQPCTVIDDKTVSFPVTQQHSGIGQLGLAVQRADGSCDFVTCLPPAP